MGFRNYNIIIFHIFDEIEVIVVYNKCLVTFKDLLSAHLPKTL